MLEIIVFTSSMKTWRLRGRQIVRRLAPDQWEGKFTSGLPDARLHPAPLLSTASPTAPRTAGLHLCISFPRSIGGSMKAESTFQLSF